MQWDKYQLAIFEDVKNGTGHTVIEALAGSGKTTTIVESVKYIPEDAKGLLTAFNKRIAEELKRRVQSFNIDISTLHSLGLKSLGATYKKITVDNYKTTNIIKKLFPKEKNVRYELEKAVNLAKAYVASTSSEIDIIMDKHDIDTFKMPRSEFINNVIVVMDICRSKPTIVDFSDMIWLPNVLTVNVPKYDRLFIDEAQDLNKAQLGLVLQAVYGPPKTSRSRAEGRVVAVGDQNQAIYGFAGADMDSISNIKNKLNAKTLPLSITYRCPVSVVKEAQVLVPTIEQSPYAIEGSVSNITLQEMKNTAKPGCFILSRKNAPLIGLAMYFIKNGIPANIQGRDIGENLLNIVRKAKSNDIESFIAYVKKWQVKEVDRLTHLERNTEQVTDKAECLFALCESVDSIDELKITIEKLFSDVDDSNKIVLSTVHKAKGLERDDVYMLAGTFFPGKQEELNIKYVAITRSKKNLYMVTSTKKELPM